MRFRLLACASVLAIGLAPFTAHAQDTTTYQYDVLGRLIGATVSGGSNDGRQTSTSFDPADNRTNYTIAGTSTSKFSIADASVTEGAVAGVTVTRTGAIGAAATVNYATSNGSAVGSTDYLAASGMLTFAAGEASKSISIATVDDGVYENEETFNVTLSAPTGGAGIARANAFVTIVDDEVVPKLSISGTTVTEGASAALAVTRSGLTSSTVTVNYATVAGAAMSPADFTAASGVLTFLPGETGRIVNVSTTNDTVYEGREAFKVVLSGASGGGQLINASAAVSIDDDDNPPSFSISSGGVTEGGTVVMTVTKSGTTERTHSVNYATADVRAIAPGDYTPTSGILTFLPAETSKSVSIPTANDNIYEIAETFSVYLSGASGGAAIQAPTGTGTINDNDVQPVLSVSNASVVEGGQAVVTITKTGATDVNATVAYATSHGTATTSDYSAASGSLMFLPEETSKSVRIPTTNNARFNLAKAFNLAISGPVGATIGNSQGVITIENDDPPPSFTVGAPTAQFEGGAIAFPVVLTGGAYEPPFTINYSTSSGTATSGVDFTLASGTLTFTSPATVQSVPVQTTQDNDVESDETIVFTISSPSHGASIVSSQAIGTIRNDDIAPTQDPVANADNAGTNFVRCDSFTINPMQNDTSPGGNYPLTLISVATGSGYTRVISGNSVTINITTGGAKSIQYVVQNSAGSQATGLINWTAASGPVCR